MAAGAAMPRLPLALGGELASLPYRPNSERRFLRRRCLRLSRGESPLRRRTRGAGGTGPVSALFHSVKFRSYGYHQETTPGLRLFAGVHPAQRLLALI